MRVKRAIYRSPTLTNSLPIYIKDSEVIYKANGIPKAKMPTRFYDGYSNTGSKAGSIFDNRNLENTNNNNIVHLSASHPSYIANLKIVYRLYLISLALSVVYFGNTFPLARQIAIEFVYN